MRDHNFFEMQLKKQIKFLIRSCQEFDMGDEDEALRMSNSLRLIFKSKGRIISLLDHLKIDGPFLYDTRRSEYNGESIYAPLVGILIQGSIFTDNEVIKGIQKYYPLCNDIKDVTQFKKVVFEKWWEDPIFILNDNKTVYSLSRKQVITTLAEQDGGTHVDPEITNFSYLVLDKINSIRAGVKILGNEPEIDNSPIYPSVRQIAFETLSSLTVIAKHLF